MLTELQIEVTSNCNAKCPGCIRESGKCWLPKNEHMDIEVYKKLLVDLRPTLKYISFEGNYSDSPMHPQFLDIIRITNEICPSVFVKISTNGSYRSTKWWAELASLLKKQRRHSVNFGIDGIDQETHTQYRVNTNFDKIISNARAFIEAGGSASWKMIPFDFNEKLIDQAERIASEVGFTNFYRNKTSRYWMIILDEVIYELFGVKRIKNQIWFDDDYFDKDEHKQIKNIISLHLQKQNFNIITTDNPDKDFDQNYHNILNTIEVTCQWEEQSRVQVSHDGTVWRCCHIEARVHNIVKDSYGKDFERWNRSYGSEAYYEKNWNNLYYHSIIDIMNHDYFAKDLPDSLTNNYDDIINPKMRRCTEKCAKFGEHKAQGI
jgi:MoaA/NifB/PqqE/SkfB family radical SAM enzyme